MQTTAPPPVPHMSRQVVRRLISGWLLRHTFIDWLLLTKIWWIFWGMGGLLVWLFFCVVAGYLDPNDGTTGVWLFGLMTSASWLVLIALFFCRALCRRLAVPDALLRMVLDAPVDVVPEADRIRLRQLVGQQGPLAYAALFRWCGKQHTAV